MGQSSWSYEQPQGNQNWEQSPNMGYQQRPPQYQQGPPFHMQSNQQKFPPRQQSFARQQQQ